MLRRGNAPHNNTLAFGLCIVYSLCFIVDVAVNRSLLFTTWHW